jgi:hypothetical protein
MTSIHPSATFLPQAQAFFREAIRPQILSLASETILCCPCDPHAPWRRANSAKECQARRPSATIARLSAKFTHTTCCMVSSIARWLGPPALELSWGGGGGHFVWRPEETSGSDCVATPERAKPPVEQRASGLVQPCGLQRLVDVPPLAPDGLGDLSGAHSFLA